MTKNSSDIDNSFPLIYRLFAVYDDVEDKYKLINFISNK